MDNPYTAFLPLEHRSGVDAEHSWWPWRGRRIHLARAPRPQAPVRLLVVHGIGAHSGALWPLASAVRDVDLTAVDLPMFGRTVCDVRETRYLDWLELLVDLVEAEDDGRPLIILGASLGGMLAAETAARSDRVDHVLATCLLDPSEWPTRKVITRFGAAGVLARPLAHLVGGPLNNVMVPISAVAGLSRISRSPGLAKLCAADRFGGGATVPLGFLASYLRHTPQLPAATPITLLHPEMDDWTPPGVSEGVLAKAEGPTEIVLLRECGHFPIEEPGISDLLAKIGEIVTELGPD